jgi:hypothetical protein
MASPFRYFRKHTKAAMAVLFVLCMVTFVFVSGTGGGGGGGPAQDGGATVATWNGGSLNQRELASLVRQRVIVNEFLQRIFNQGGGRTGYDLPGSVPNLLLSSERLDQVETEVIATEVMASLAREAGITVSDDMVNHYIEEFSLNNVTQDEILGIMASVGQNDARENEAIVFSMLRKMLAAYFYRSTYEDATAIVLPQERWNDWRRVNERISLSAAVLPVETFEKDVPKPTESDLLAFYNERKDVEPNLHVTFDNGATSLPAPNPGFAQPRRVRLSFLLGSVGERSEQYLDKVTEDEIADYYERNKRRLFVKTDFGSEEDEAPAPGEEAAPGDESATEEEAPAEGSAADREAEAAPATTRAAEEPAAAAETPAAPSEPAVPAEGAATPADEAAQTPSSGASSAVKRRSPFRLAAFQNEPAETPAPAESTPSSEPAETPATDEAAPAGEVETPREESQPSDGESENDAADADAAAPGEEAASDEDKIDEILEYEPLEKVRDDIRETLARDKAAEELGRVMNEAAAELQSEFNRYGLAAAMAREAEKPEPKPPAKLADLQWLADKYKLTYEKTALLTDRELFDTAVGKAADAQGDGSSVTRAAFLTLKPFEPYLAKELGGDFYLVVKTDDQPRRVPEFKDVRDKVEAEWKRNEAAKLAEKKAEELAKEVSAPAQTQSFEDFFKGKGYEVIPQTELFSWLKYPLGAGQQRPPSLSDAPPLKNVGPEFMDAAFSLNDDEAKGLLNFDRSAAYVIRLHTQQYPEDELKKIFLQEDRTFWPGRNEMRIQRIFGAKEQVEKKVLEERAGFKFDEEWLKRRQEREQSES